jgi:hypothetical protein
MTVSRRFVKRYHRQMQWPQKYPKVSKVSRSLISPLRGDDGFIVDPGKLLFSVNTFIAAGAVLVISFTASLPRPWWALLTVYVTAQPMAGAFRPRVLYRLGGITAGAIVAIALVPNLQNSPVLLVLCLALWTGFLHLPGCLRPDTSRVPVSDGRVQRPSHQLSLPLRSV